MTALVAGVERCRKFEELSVDSDCFMPEIKWPRWLIAGAIERRRIEDD
jgi:hypothetical protein